MILRAATLILALSALVACEPAAAVADRRILVDPAGSAEPGFETVRDLASVPFSSLGPGSEVAVKGGTYASAVVVSSRGSAGKPVRITARPGPAPVLTNSVVFEGADHVIVSGLTVRGAEHSGFIIRKGSAHVTVERSAVENSGLGIWIGAGSLAGHRIAGNRLTDNKTHGVAVDVINAPPESPTLILDNVVERNGIHGMEINGSGYVVEGNRVRDNGVLMSGTSGIHLFAKNAAQDAGDRNVIRFNIVTGQRETTGQDGNGIQIDQWCDGNTVAFNVTTENDGAGINLFDAGKNRVFNNTVTGNMRDSGGRHAYKGELVVASDFTKSVGRAVDNVVFNNLVVATRKGVAAIAVESTSIGKGNAFGPNMLDHREGGDLYVWGAKRVKDGSGLPLGGSGPDLLERPAFVDPSKPFEGGLALTRAPSRLGAAIGTGSVKDVAGREQDAGAPAFGAYAGP